MDNSTGTAREITIAVKERTDALFKELFIPRMEHHLDLKMHQWLESLVEKKIEERFAFALELLRSMNDKAKTADGH